jgi:hypothetical protein
MRRYKSGSPRPPDWTGEWRITWSVEGGEIHPNKMKLNQKGNEVEGKYNWQEGWIKGNVNETGNVLKGIWTETSTDPTKDKGNVKLTMKHGGNSFTGDWKYGFVGGWEPPWDGTWDGERIRK